MHQDTQPFQPQAQPAGGYRFPVSVIVERREITRGRWSFPTWEVTGVVAGERPGAGSAKIPIHSDDQCQRYLWSGLTLEFFRDETESYWHNLQGSQPSLFVICREENEDDDESLEPYIVTADPHEADAHLETEGTVFAVPIPPDLYQWLEQYVVSYYRPSEQKTRKRKRWKEDEHDGQAPARGRRH